ncbi:MarR family winged helix-turn-helix transcriptional regulator [Cohnella luojiensis]|uniref:MarR family transcriptional regulator n=1 Tax=Cohnella luojiensis TaxID=652876 RepID=A0A4Y8LNY3_9BACL|nr:MarR family transcriptional regulator [Cohnella luojiensis]TFE22691.1 MarR family transcriptional regulator [Cohnella luojiensis]
MNYKDYRLEDSLGFIVSVAGKTMNQRLFQNFKLAGYEVTPEQWQVLVQLWNREERSQYEISVSTCRDQTSTSRLMDTLVKRGYIERKDDPADRRIKLIILTARGKELQKSLIELAQQTLLESTAGISKDELKTATEVLKKITANLQ